MYSINKIEIENGEEDRKAGRREGNEPDQGVDLGGLDTVELADSLGDLGLVGAEVDDEDDGVVLLDLLHGSLSREGVLDDGVLEEN